MANTQLTTSHSQPIYVPGKYSPSSCLSDKEEDEIYGFGYGVFSRQMLQQRQQKLALAAQNTTAVTQGGLQQQAYQSCLSPRSAFFYEFPPNEQGQNPSKKKTTFSRLLRGLKTHRKEKQAQTQGSPRHGRARMGVPQRVDTPDSVLQSGLGLGPDMGHTILRSMVDPRDYDRLRYLQMNGGQPNSFEETIHRLKVQEALRKKERFHKEHEEILRDIRQGLMQLGRDGRGQLPGDDTYMYDEDARCGGIGPGPGGQHWYDEPPYESDPEDFLMGTSGGPMPTATIQNGRVCFTLNLRSENRGEGVISLRTAGDISLPRDRSRKGATSMMRGLIVPQGHNNPPAIIPLTHSRASRESGDYASSDVQSRSSGEEGLSPSQSSDYEDQEELENQHSAAVHTSEASALLEGDATRAGVAGRARNLRHDVQRKISRLRQDRTSSEAFPCSASSVESLPSGSGSSTQALVRAGSNHSSISYEDRDTISPTSIGPVLCRARALVDYTPSPYDKEALKFKKGDIIDVIQMNKSGLWKGVMHNRIGHFKFINVEILNDRVTRRGEPDGRGKWGQRYRQKPGSVQELLQRMNLQEHIPVFVLNGYEDLELFREIEPADLDYLRIHQPEHRAKILTAVQLLHELQSGSEGELASSSEGDEVSRLVLTSGQTSGHCSPFNRRQFPRDSGCYDAHKNPTSRRTVSPESATSSKLPRENNLDAAAPSKTASSIGGEGSTVSDSKDDFHPNIPITSNVAVQKEGQFDKSPLLRSGNVRFIGKRGNFGETVVIEDACESGQKLGGIAKYVVGTSDLGLEGTGNVAGLGQRGCLSEKSSDSGVSSSSISSAPPPRDKVLANVALDSPTKNFSNFSRASPTSQPASNKSQTGETSYE
ncbi:SAM and SH3 domain-containing protein 1 [Anthophora plagiata]